MSLTGAKTWDMHGAKFFTINYKTPILAEDIHEEESYFFNKGKRTNPVV